MNHHVKKWSWGILVLIVAMVGCSKPPTSELVSKLLVQTYYDSSVNFKNYATYSFMLDTVAYADYGCNCWSLVTDGNSTYISDITDNVKQALDNAGYTQVDSVSTPDLSVHATIVNGFVVSRGHNYSFSQYSFGYNTYSFPFVGPDPTTQATLVIEVTDLKFKKYRSIWVAYLSDVGTTNDTYTNPTLIAGIKQAFSQSSYLTRN